MGGSDGVEVINISSESVKNLCGVFWFHLNKVITLAFYHLATGTRVKAKAWTPADTQIPRYLIVQDRSKQHRVSQVNCVRV